MQGFGAVHWPDFPERRCQLAEIESGRVLRCLRCGRRVLPQVLELLGKVLNSETLEWSPISPTFKITRSTNWEHQWPAWWRTEVCTELHTALAKVRRQREDAEKRRVEYTLREQVKARLDALRKKIPLAGGARLDGG